ncbi:MAG: hypothetical protein RR340_09540 [Cloacibacillus sp.]
MSGPNDLIGLPWGFAPGQIDCLKLALAAQDKIYGRVISLAWNYTPENYEARTHDILHELEMISDRITAPEPGAVLLFDFAPVYHLGTFISLTHFLHIPRDGTSRLTRWSVPYQKRTIGIYRISEVPLW